MGQQAIFYRVENDRAPRIDMEFEDTNLASFTTIELRVRREDGILFTSPAVIDDGPNGLCHFDFEVGDLTEGNHLMEFRFVDTSSKPMTIPADAPLSLVVRSQI